MFIVPKGIRRAARAAHFFPQARSKLSQNVHYSIGKKERPPGRTPARDRERPARTSFLEKRDKY